jgi:RNA methyltransferase, TrmH family
LAEAARLHRSTERSQRGETLLEGPNLLAEAIRAGVTPTTVFALVDDTVSRQIAADCGAIYVPVDEPGLTRVAGTKSPRGPVAVIPIPGTLAMTVEGLLVAWGVSDPGNVGTMIRTAAAFGWGFGHTGSTADPWSPKVLRAGAGAQFSAPIAAIADVDEVHRFGFEPVATVVRGGTPPDQLRPGRYAVLIGEEAAGLPGPVVDASQIVVTIPMPGGTESLNAAMAAGMILYELSKDRPRDS